MPYVDKVVSEDHQIFIKRLIFQGLPDYNTDGGFQPTIIIFQAKGGTFKGDVLFNSAWKTQGACNSNAYFKANESKQQVSFEINISCSGDLHVRVYHKNKISLRFNINTYFLRNKKDIQIDNGNGNAFGKALVPLCVIKKKRCSKWQREM